MVSRKIIDGLGLFAQRFLLLALVSILLVRLAVILFESPAALVGMISDDAFYYLGTARNIVLGYGSTFDRLNVSNGYHPLWMVALIALASLMEDAVVLLRYSLVLQFILWCATLFLVYTYFSKKNDSASRIPAFSAVIILLYGRFVSVALGGLESSLVLLVATITVIYIRMESHRDSMGLSKICVFGMLLGILFLSRLDNIFLVFALTCFIFLKARILESKNISIRIFRCVCLLLPIIVLSLPFIGFTWYTFGHLLPISGALKTSFPRIDIHLEYLVSYPEWLWIPPLTLLAYLFLGLRDVASRKLYVSMVWCSVGILAHALYCILFMNWAVFSWHFVSYLPILSFFIGDMVGFFQKAEIIPVLTTKTAVITYSALCVALLFMFTSQVFSIATPESWHTASYQAALHVRENTPQNTVFAMKDCGVFGYFSERKVINLDGVINSYGYQEYLHEGRLREYLCSFDVSYVAQHSLKLAENFDSKLFDYDKYLLRLPSRLYGGGDQLEFHPSGEFYKSIYYAGTLASGSDQDGFVIWKIFPCDSVRRN